MRLRYGKRRACQRKRRGGDECPTCHLDSVFHAVSFIRSVL
jgi:hypothetical protein